MTTQDAYTLHKQRRIRFPRRKTYSKGIADLCQVDLADLTNISRYDDSHRFLLTVIDVFSKKAWVVPLLSKSADRVTDAFESVLASAPKCALLQSDRGTEFLNEKFQSMLRRHNIHFYTSENYDIKAAVVEKFNRTLKTKMYKYLTFKNTRRYIDVLQDLVDSYNATRHRSIGMAPNDVNADNEQLVRSQLYPPKKPVVRWHFDVDDTVRIAKARHSPFDKGYTHKWTRELFRIRSRVPTGPPTYTLKDMADEPIKGRFYRFEIQEVDDNRDGRFAIDKILKTKRGADGKVIHYVSWLGYPPKFNSWVHDLVNIDTGQPLEFLRRQSTKAGSRVHVHLSTDRNFFHRHSRSDQLVARSPEQRTVGDAGWSGFRLSGTESEHPSSSSSSRR